MSYAIQARNLTKRFGATVALDGLDLDVPEESVYAMVGPNGAGKTTAIKVLMNILRPNSGDSAVLGISSSRLAPHQFTRIGYVSENQELPGWMSVDYFLSYLKPFYPAWDDALADQLVRQFDLPRGREIRHLSRGMQMKVALASSLAYRPRLIVLDEPFTGLDALVRDELIEGLLECAAGTTIFISSHDLSEIESFASHVGYLDQGRLRFSEEMASLASRFREIEIVFEAPPPLPADWPSHWLSPEASAAVVRFVDSRFEEKETPAEIRRRFPGAGKLSIRPMPLRSIFVALARASRKAA